MCAIEQPVRTRSPLHCSALRFYNWELRATSHCLYSATQRYVFCRRNGALPLKHQSFTVTCFNIVPFAEVVGFGELIRVMAMRSRDTRRRVKLYILNDDLQWEDKGTGHVTIATGSGMADWMWPVLCVRSEEDGKPVCYICKCILHVVGQHTVLLMPTFTPMHFSNCACCYGDVYAALSVYACSAACMCL